MTAIAIIARQLGFAPVGHDPVFNEIDATYATGRHALVGRNGSGKSLLARVLADELAPTQGHVTRHMDIAYLPQRWTSFTGSVASALRLDDKLDALRRIEAGSTDPMDFHVLGDDWSVRERARHWLDDAGPPNDLARPWASLSGGERVRLRLAQMFALAHHFLILDEPGNHLDQCGHRWLRERLAAHTGGYLLVSHDRHLLADVESIDELSPRGLRRHGGSYASYAAHRETESQAAERQLDQARREHRALEQRQQQERQRLTQRQQKAGRERANANMPTILLDRRKQRSQDTGARLLAAQRAQRARLLAHVLQAREHVDMHRVHRFDLGHQAATHASLQLEGAIPPHGHDQPIDLHLTPGKRLHLHGDNGSGKSSLLAAISGHRPLRAGRIRRGKRTLLIDQYCSLLRDAQSALDNLQRLSPGHTPTHYRDYLAGIGLRGERADLPAGTLSGGERMKLALLALDSATEPYDLLLLDEADSHLDLDSRALLEQALASYRGTLVLVSHDPALVAATRIDKELRLHKPLAPITPGR
ncbi:ATP-binding cassette domain-containing protein [Dyella sp. ASV21]|uniref:ATP-binding cassette domain-containing protein n=1 Tax=Dyella sp. ASV21 TaxID=2795114 RepID=UPI0018EC2184|nr:ATP-binding cassette domain-containing protein [Dyella sp. ASV21]